jgi:hypothetical protein
LPVVEGKDCGQLLHPELLCKLRQSVDVDLGKPHRAFQSRNVLLEQLRRAGRVLHYFTRGAECYIISRAEQSVTLFHARRGGGRRNRRQRLARLAPRRVEIKYCRRCAAWARE